MGSSIVATWVRALRLPFVTASGLPFAYGFLLAGRFAAWPFGLGLAAVLCTHLAANLANDWADTRSGADARDPTHYGFFGGSKLILTGGLPEAFYRDGALGFATVAAGCVLAAAILFDRLAALAFFAGILLLAVSYSVGPLRLAYRRVGELVIFLLFGPATVVGGFYLATGELSADALLASVPMGLLVAAILVCNEVPDAADDAAAGKRNLVGLIGVRRGWLLYAGLVAAAYACVGLLVFRRLLGPWALLALATALPAAAAADILRRHPGDKPRLVRASELTIAAQTLASVALIAAAVVGRPQ